IPLAASVLIFLIPCGVVAAEADNSMCERNTPATRLLRIKRSVYFFMRKATLFPLHPDHSPEHSPIPPSHLLLFYSTHHINKQVLFPEHRPGFQEFCPLSGSNRRIRALKKRLLNNGGNEKTGAG